MDAWDIDRGLIKRYLLGDLPEQELERVEERLLTDREFCEEVSMARTDLLDDYVGAVLNPQERQQFETYFLSTPKNVQRVEIARTLSDRLANELERLKLPDIPPKPFYAQHLTLIVTLAAVVVLFAGFVIWQTIAPPKPGPAAKNTPAQPSILQAELDRINKGFVNSDQNAMGVVGLTLKPILVRDLGDNRSVKIPSNPSLIQLRLELPSDAYQNYKAILKTDEGIELAAIDSLTSQSANKSKVVLLNLPSWLMNPGNYQVELSGRVDSGRDELVSLYPFDIVSQ